MFIVYCLCLFLMFIVYYTPARVFNFNIAIEPIAI